MIKNKTKVLVIGSGLTGSIISIFLAKAGFNVSKYEKRVDSRSFNELQISQRTIGMSISIRGLSALQKLGIDKYIIESATPTYGRISHCNERSEIQYYSNNKNSILTIDRRGLNEVLLNKLDSYENAESFFDHNLEHIDFLEKKCVFRVNGKLKHVEYDYLLGADGIFSACRTIYEKFININSQMEKVDIGYKEFILPFSLAETKNMDENFIHTWSSVDKRAILVALPSKERQSFLVNIFCPEKWVGIFNSNNSIKKFILTQFPSTKALLSNAEEELFNGTTSAMYQIRNNYWNYEDSFISIGDASHAICPFYAMGMNLCFESCEIFINLLEKNQNNLGDTIRSFQSVRKKDTDSMLELAYENFSNIATSNSKYYQNVWKLERKLHDFFPEKWKPEYHLIAFSKIPLAEVRQKILKQRNIIKKIVNESTGLLKDGYTKKSIDNLLKIESIE